jgi:hypothetical protein
MHSKLKEHIGFSLIGGEKELIGAAANELFHFKLNSI